MKSQPLSWLELILYSLFLKIQNDLAKPNDTESNNCNLEEGLTQNLD